MRHHRAELWEAHEEKAWGLGLSSDTWRGRTLTLRQARTVAVLQVRLCERAEKRRV